MAAHADIVIVGAGAAGVGAARALSGSGLSVVMLEAAPRVGGRALTLDVAGLPLDLGCGWLHSADRNPWTEIAEAAGFALERGTSAWLTQFRDLGFAPDEQRAARAAMMAWADRLSTAPPASDRVADCLEPGGPWDAYIRARVGFISGAVLERISAADYAAYDAAATRNNWRVPAGYGTLVASHLPPDTDLHLSTPAEAVALSRDGVRITTARGSIDARAAILGVSTNVLAGPMIDLPDALDPWREAAARLPLGQNEKLFLEIVGDAPFETETHVMGNPRDARTAGYYIRPFGRPVIEVYLGAESAAAHAAEGPMAAFAHAIDELAALFGASARGMLRPLVTSNWSRTTHVGGAYSSALPGHAAARLQLASPFEDRVFFAGEATSVSDFSTAHGAYMSGMRAAGEAVAALAAPRQAARG